MRATGAMWDILVEMFQDRLVASGALPASLDGQVYAKCCFHRPRSVDFAIACAEPIKMVERITHNGVRPQAGGDQAGFCY